jgi:putative FmdB family regulatory protein
MEGVNRQTAMQGAERFDIANGPGRLESNQGKSLPEVSRLPLYEYRCTSCGYSFEKIQSFSAEPEKVCPKCQGVLIRPVTAPALRFEGAGWYVNDYAGKGGSKAGEAAKDSASAGTDSKSESKSDAKPDSAAASTESKPAASTPAASTPAASSSTTSSSS